MQLQLSQPFAAMYSTKVAEEGQKDRSIRPGRRNIYRQFVNGQADTIWSASPGCNFLFLAINSYPSAPANRAVTS